MTVVLVAVGLALLAWPVRRPAQRRLRELAGAGRLASAVAAGPGWAAAGVRDWLRAVQPGRPRHPVALSRLAVAAGAAIAGLLAALWRGPAVGVASAVTGALVLSGLARATRRAAVRSRDRDLSAALRLLRAELDVGSTGATALAAAATVAGVYRPAFEAGAAAARDGADVETAMSSAAGEQQRELFVVARAWRLADELGVPLAGVLARIDEDVQARRAQNRMVASALAGPRSSAALLACLPVLGMVLGAAMGAHPLQVLFDSGGGRMLLCAGVLLDAAGIGWTARLIDSAERR